MLVLARYVRRRLCVRSYDSDDAVKTEKIRFYKESSKRGAPMEALAPTHYLGSAVTLLPIDATPSRAPLSK